MQDLSYLRRKRLQSIAKLGLTESGSFQAKRPTRQKGILKVAGLGAAYLSFQARNREGGELKSSRRGRLGDLIRDTPPPAARSRPPLLSRSAGSGATAAKRNSEDDETSVERLI